MQYIRTPQTIRQAVQHLLSDIPADSLKQLACMKHDELGMCHFGLAMWIRANYDLTPLLDKSMQRFRVGKSKSLFIDPDSLSNHLIELLWRRLQNQSDDTAPSTS